MRRFKLKSSLCLKILTGIIHMLAAVIIIAASPINSTAVILSLAAVIAGVYAIWTLAAPEVSEIRNYQDEWILVSAGKEIMAELQNRVLLGDFILILHFVSDNGKFYLALCRDSLSDEETYRTLKVRSKLQRSNHDY